MNLYEEFAIGQFLSEWPENMSYQEMMNTLMRHDNEEHDCSQPCVIDDFGAREPFIYYAWEWLANQIELTRQSLERLFIARSP